MSCKNWGWIVPANDAYDFRKGLPMIQDDQIMKLLLMRISETSVGRAELLGRHGIFFVAQLLTYDHGAFLRLPHTGSASFKKAQVYMREQGLELGCLAGLEGHLSKLVAAKDVRTVLENYNVVEHLRKQGFPRTVEETNKIDLMEIFEKKGLSATYLRAVLDKPGALEKFKKFLRTIDPGNDPAP